MQNGYSSLNIRAVAAACEVSVGSVYYYFKSKSDLLEATIESIWHEIFHRPENPDALCDIRGCIHWMYECLKYGSEQFPGFFSLHCIGFIGDDKETGRQKMQQTWDHIRTSLCEVLKHDPKIRADAFNSHFTPEECADLIFSAFLSDAVRKKYDPDVILEAIRRVLY